ncbi:MAG: PEP-utilizing enzyme [Actinomycetota bacterium]
MVADRWITDLEPSQKFPVYTRANAGEVLPDPASPLAWTLVWEPGVVEGWADANVSAGTVVRTEFTSAPPEVVGLFGGYLYINGSLARLFGVRGPGLTAEMIDFVYFGEHPDVPKYVHEDWHDDPAATERLGAWMGEVLTAADLPGHRDDQARANQTRADRGDLGALTDAELVERARSLIPFVRHLFWRHLDTTAGTSVGPGALGAIAEAMGDPSIVLTLITGIGDVDSALPSLAMWELSRLPADSAEFRQGFEAFLAEYGSRGPNEWDIRSEVWETKPVLALALIEAMRPAADSESPAARNAKNVAKREALEAQIRTALADQPEALGTFELALRSAHLYMAGRERAKTNIIKVIHEMRMAMRELAVRHDYTMSEVCMLLADELDAFVAAPDEFRARLTAREEQYLELFHLDPPFIVNGSVKPLSQWARRGGPEASKAVVGDVLSGVPGSPGVATGRARVILDPADPLALEPGDVLIAPITDPAWTPLFVPAAAVVVNVGAQVSHAVIVSRELGIPCVVSVLDATQRIPDGALVTVDGTTGTVTLVEG